MIFTLKDERPVRPGTALPAGGADRGPPIESSGVRVRSADAAAAAAAAARRETVPGAPRRAASPLTWAWRFPGVLLLLLRQPRHLCERERKASAGKGFITENVPMPSRKSIVARNFMKQAHLFTAAFPWFKKVQECSPWQYIHEIWCKFKDSSHLSSEYIPNEPLVFTRNRQSSAIHSVVFSTVLNMHFSSV